MFAIKKSLLGKITLTKDEAEGKAVHFPNRRAVLNSVAKREYVETVFDRLRDYDLATFAIVMERPAKPPYSAPNVLQVQHQRLLLRIDKFMEKEHPNHFAIPVFDGQDPTNNQRFSDCFTSFMARHQTGKAMTHVVPSPLFVDSYLTPGIQIADLFAYVIRLDFENGLSQNNLVSDPYFSTIKRYAKVVRQKTLNFEREDGGPLHGISTMDATKFIYEAPHALPADDLSELEPDEAQGSGET